MTLLNSWIHIEHANNEIQWQIFKLDESFLFPALIYFLLKQEVWAEQFFINILDLSS